VNQKGAKQKLNRRGYVQNIVKCMQDVRSKQFYKDGVPGPERRGVVGRDVSRAGALFIHRQGRIEVTHPKVVDYRSGVGPNGRVNCSGGEQI